MGEIWVSESGQVGRVWAIRRKRKDFHSLYFFSVEYLRSWVIFHGTNGPGLPPAQSQRRSECSLAAGRARRNKSGGGLGFFGWVDAPNIE